MNMTTLLMAVPLAAMLVSSAMAADPQPGPTPAPASQKAVDDLLAGRFSWTAGGPLVSPASRPEDTCFSMKDPSVVFFEGRWHLFCTIRSEKRTHQIEYLSFADWKDADKAERHVLKIHDGFFCAPQVFYFAPQKKWYLIYQASDESWTPTKYQAAFSTTDTIADPASWTRPQPLRAQPAGDKVGLDFWIICDDTRAHFFFTTLDGRMWREETSLADFPHGWSKPVPALEGDVFEASHTYRLKGMDKYLTLIEAQNGRGWRYFKAYLADRLDGKWTPIAATREKAFADMGNVAQPGGRWTDCISHGELLRDGCDQTLQVDPANLRFLFQGVLDKDRAGKDYGRIPWRLGILTPAEAVPGSR